MPIHSAKSGARIVQSQSLVDEFLAKEFSRRQMVKNATLASVGAWLGGAGLAACGSDGGSAAPISNTDAGNGNTDSGTQKPAHLVGMGYHESDRGQALRAALAETMGLSMIRPGQSVYLRVNTNSGDMYPYSTSPETLTMVGGMLRDMGITDLRIGDRSFWGDKDTAGNFEANGLAEAARALGTTAMVFSDDDDKAEWMALPPESVPNWTGTVRLPTAVTTADHMIILSIVKTHFIATITMSLKISLGLVHANDRARAGNLKSHDTRVLYKQTAQINKAFTPSLVINDSYSAVISGGPTMRDKPNGAPASWSGGITGDPKVFIVSPDRIAADVAGIAVLQTLSPKYEAVMKTKPFENPQIMAAVEAGLGITGPEAFDLSGPTVPMIEEYRAKVLG